MTATFPCNLHIVPSFCGSRPFVMLANALPSVIETSVRAASPMRVLQEALCHLIPRLVDGTDSLDELRSPTASQTRRRDHPIVDIRVDTGHQEGGDRAEIPALV